MTKQTETPVNEIEKKLGELAKIQLLYSKLNEINTIKGELPLEVQDLKDDIIGFNSRIENLNLLIEEQKKEIEKRKHSTKDFEGKIKKYKDQLNSVRNSREHDSLSKEIEFNELEIQLCEKKNKQSLEEIERLQVSEKKTLSDIKEKKKLLEEKEAELASIMSETNEEERKLNGQINKSEKMVEERLMKAFTKIRENSANGLAVVKLSRNACGGCFNQVPPQKQLEIKQKSSIIVCEHCGRIIIDEELFGKTIAAKKE